MNRNEFVKYCIKKVLDNNHLKILVLLDKYVLNHVTQTEIAKIIKISLPLMSYYINGNKKTKGLYEFGFIEFVTTKSGHHIGIRITESGREILKVMKE